MEPVIMALKEEYRGKVAFVIVDVQEQEGRQLASEYAVRNIPHLIIVDSQGQIIYNQAGAKPESFLRDVLELARGS